METQETSRDLENRRTDRLDYPTIEHAFPEAEPDLEPSGEKVLLQLRSPKRKSAGGILLVQETKDTEVWNTQVAKVIALGPVALRTAIPWNPGPRETGPSPESSSVSPSTVETVGGCDRRTRRSRTRCPFSSL